LTDYFFDVWNFLSELIGEFMFELLEKRLKEYRVAIMGNTGSSNMAMHMLQVASINVQKVQSIDREMHLFDSDFWGHGINAICDGIETHSQYMLKK
jgi:hypothetical protein